jgi:hypothetical protein
MNPETREHDLALELQLHAQNAVMAWANEGDLNPADIEAQTLGVLLQAAKIEADAQGLPWERIIAEVTR